MKQGSRGFIKRMLSGVALVGLLGLFVVQEAEGATDAYLVRPQANTHNNGYNYASQSFVAVCDSITKIAFFLGQKSGSSNYQMEIDSAGIAKGGVLTLSAAGADDYADNEGTYGTPVAVKRGYTYTLKFSRQSAMETVDFYYRPDSTYAWGRIEYPGTVTGDLCARVIGRNRIPQTLFGINTYFGVSSDWVSQARVDTLMTKLDSAGMKLSREQIPWYYIQGDFGSPNVYSWEATDRAVAAAQSKGLPILISIDRTPKWASSYNDSLYPNDTARWHAAPPKNLDTTYDSGANYFYNLMCSLATRYAPQGVHDWEIGNEVNLLVYWDFWWKGHYYTNYDSTHSGRSKLYKRACQVAWDAIKGVDSGARIYTNGVVFLNSVSLLNEALPSATGKQWLRDFYYHGGKSCTDVITYHFYPEDTIWAHRFRPWKFQADYDTVRAILREKNDTTRTVWLDEGGWGTSTNPNYTGNAANVGREKQADVAVQFYNAGIGQLINPLGPLGNVGWYSAFNFDRDTTPTWKNSGVLEWPSNGVAYKQSGYAYKQMTGKLKDKYFNRQVPVGSPSDSVYCYEFEEPGSGKRTWVVWKTTQSPVPESISIRTDHAYYDSTYYRASGYAPVPLINQIGASGKVRVDADTVPIYVYESATDSLHRPDVIVDSLWLVPSNPRAGEGLRFYARIKNISTTDSLKANITNLVKFQVDGVTKATYQAQRGLGVANSGIDTLTVGYYGNSTNGGEGWDRDWTAKWGDHLIRDWVDSLDKFVELREDNNQGYIFRHMAPSGKVTIPGTGYPNGRKFTTTRSTMLSLLSNGGTTPAPDSMRLRGSWEQNWRAWQEYETSWSELLSEGDEMKWLYAQFKMADGETSATTKDSIILDTSPPTAYICTPTDSEEVNGEVTFWGSAHDGYAYFRVDTLWYHHKTTHARDTIHVSLLPTGEMMMGELGTWNTNLVTNGWTRETLAVWDSAGNASYTYKDLFVYNNSTNDGDGWFASGFGSFGSAPMNLATDPNGNLIVAETQGSTLRAFSSKKDTLFTFSARRGDSTGLNWAVGMALKDTTILYVADGYGHCVKAFDRQGNLLLRFGSFGQEPGQFRQPAGIALDFNRRLWVCDRLNQRVQVFDSTGKILFQFGSQGADSGRFSSPTGIAITPKGLVFISDTKNHQVQVFDSLGKWVKTIKKPDSLGFDTPLGICSDKRGNIYVADGKHHRIVKLNPFGQRLFVFGKEGDSLCQFKNPIGVTSSPGGHYLYVADMGNKRVTRFTVVRGDTTGGGPQAGAVVHLLPLVYELGPAIPNPSKGQTTFRYALPKESLVNFTIYNVAGQVVREFNQDKQKAGYYSITWDGRSNLGHKVGAGVYFYRLQVGSWVKTRKMIVIR